jgi:hypothetical protein
VVTAKRSTWLDSRAAELVAELGTLGLTMTQEAAAELVRERVRFIAEQAGFSERTARSYLTADVVRSLARVIALDLADERPGSDVLSQPRTIPVATTVLGRTIAGLSYAARAIIESHDLTRADQALRCIATIGVLLADSDGNHGALSSTIMAPEALLARARRILDSAVAGMNDGSLSLQGEPAELVKAIARDAAALRDLLATHGTGTGPTPGI